VRTALALAVILLVVAVAALTLTAVFDGANTIPAWDSPLTR
jgi:hypothetical protein